MRLVGHRAVLVALEAWEPLAQELGKIKEERHYLLGAAAPKPLTVRPNVAAPMSLRRRAAAQSQVMGQQGTPGAAAASHRGLQRAEILCAAED